MLVEVEVEELDEVMLDVLVLVEVLVEVLDEVLDEVLEVVAGRRTFAILYEGIVVGTPSGAPRSESKRHSKPPLLSRIAKPSHAYTSSQTRKHVPTDERRTKPTRLASSNTVVNRRGLGSPLTRPSN